MDGLQIRPTKTAKKTLTNKSCKGLTDMKRTLAYVALACGFCLLCGADWPQFRGPASRGVADDARPPLTWSEKENTAWKAELPGRGPSSPIVVSDRVFVTCSSGVRQDRLHVLCFEGKSGKQLWHRQFWATGRTLTHPSSAVAAPTPASDGQRVFAFYSSNDLICLDLDGNLQWYRGLAHDYPKAGNDVGMASSPVVIGETVVVQIESQGDSFAAGINTATGETRWRVDRGQRSNWTSPVVLPAQGKRPAAVLLQAPDGLTAVDARTGDELWSHKAACEGVPSSVATGDRIYLPSNGITALSVSDQSAAYELAWDSNKLGPGSASPVVDDDHIYTVNRAGVITCASTEDGVILWQLRVKGPFWGTPALAGGHMYLINQDGLGQVVKLGDKGELVGESPLGETIQASPAVAGGALYVRSDKHLWKIAAE
jgi:outer membrane protein assembly factor BamB